MEAVLREMPGLIMMMGGTVHVAKWTPPVWTVVKIEPREEFTVSADYKTCSCGAGAPCVHVLALKWGKYT